MRARVRAELSACQLRKLQEQKSFSDHSAFSFTMCVPRTLVALPARAESTHWVMSVCVGTCLSQHGLSSGRRTVALASRAERGERGNDGLPRGLGHSCSPLSVWLGVPLITKHLTSRTALSSRARCAHTDTENSRKRPFPKGQWRARPTFCCYEANQ